ncbi:MAG: MetQ/NlpA family ABC transporter substrate-binding protein [Bacilli bacterium]|jgi:D-methionine transport system substrate-binding protein|nr:MetQ/NlpA family ABC transporter substrate-binding protein [Bacilli bacterium]
MSNFKKTLLAILPLAILLAGCGNQTTSSTARKDVIIGTMAQPGDPILQHVKEAYEKKGDYTLSIQLFTDFTTPNFALSDGSIDANLFQHEPYLNTYNQKNNTDLFCAGKLYDCVYGGYSKKYDSLEKIPDGSKITIASDSSNMKRCLNILAASSLLELNELPATVNPSDIDSYIKTNTHKFIISPMSTDLIAASLDDEDVALGLVNATFAIAAGLTSTQLLCQEKDPEHVNANIVACRKGDKSSQWIKDLISVLESDDTKSFINSTFKGVVTPYFVDFVNV